MRVLLLHNRYRIEGGEERAVREIAELLRSRGDQVEVLERSSASLGAGRAAGAMLAGGVHPDQVARAVRRMRADVVHVHNIHPLFGWRALAAARGAGARTVLHLHNFRLFCAIGIAYRDGRVCFRCRATNTYPGLQLRCRGSLAEAAVYAAGLRHQQPRLLAGADRLVAVSEALRTRLVELGLPPEHTSVLPNFVPRAAVAANSRADRGKFALVAGRLVEEKGIDTAIAAAAEVGVPLVVAGAGPDEARLRNLVATGEIRFVGRVPAAELAELRAQAAVVLAPSRWEEPCPYSVLEALAAGVPVLASDRGGLPELVGGDAALPAEDPGAWVTALGRLWRDPAQRRTEGERGIERVRDRFGEDRYYAELRRAYGR
jgi:glycosyltransferase involved in cell wall biosynthesis